MKHIFQNLLTLITIVFIATSCSPKQDATNLNPSLFAHLNQVEVLQLTLEADWQKLIENKHSEAAPPAPVRVSWQNSNGIIQQLNGEVGVRGHARRNICDFPPLKLKFSEENLATSGWNSDYKSLKLVTHCINDNEDLLLREYLTYKMLQQLTENSFRVQLAKVTYKSNKDTLETYAFLIENNEEMAERLGGALIESELSKLTSIDTKQYSLMTVFQYMIGNTDWNMAKQHNIKLVRFEEKTVFLPVPYDFDYSGMVNAAYALPPVKLPIKSVRERFFQWRGTNAAPLQQTLELFREKKNALYDLVIHFEPLSMDSRLDMLSYMDSFYKDLPQAPKLATR